MSDAIWQAIRAQDATIAAQGKQIDALIRETNAVLNAQQEQIKDLQNQIAAAQAALKKE